MKVLENQTLFQCDHCGKRLLTKHGAKIHEEEYCNSSALLIDKGYEILINCQHDWIERWEPIPGEEHLRQPSHDECTKCGAEDYLVLLKRKKISLNECYVGSRLSTETKGVMA